MCTSNRVTPCVSRSQEIDSPWFCADALHCDPCPLVVPGMDENCMGQVLVERPEDHLRQCLDRCWLQVPCVAFQSLLSGLGVLVADSVRESSEGCADPRCFKTLDCKPNGARGVRTWSAVGLGKAGSLKLPVSLSQKEKTLRAPQISLQGLGAPASVWGRHRESLPKHRACGHQGGLVHEGASTHDHAHARARMFCGLVASREPLEGRLQRPAALDHHARERRLVQHPIAGWPEGPRVSQCQRQR